MGLSTPRPHVHLRMLTPEDAAWMCALDRAGFEFVDRAGWEEGKLAAELDEGVWASEQQWGWAVIVDGDPAGVAFARGLANGEGRLEVRLAEPVRGRGVGREVLRQLADHHFAASPTLRRITGRSHEHHVAMQRAFAGAGFRMEARFRDAIPQGDGDAAAAWGYALTRGDWEEGRHRQDDDGFDLHALTFTLEDADDAPGHMPRGATARFVQEGHRVLVTYAGGKVWDGEGAGVAWDDVVHYRFAHRWGDTDVVLGRGRARLQRRGDGRLEIIDEWVTDDGACGRHVWAERR